MGAVRSRSSEALKSSEIGTRGNMETLERFEQYQRVIEDFTSRTLAVIPGDIGRLFHVATLRDLSTGRYRHDGLAAIYSEPAVHDALAYCHDELFRKVLEMPLERQERDLRLCLSSLESPLAEIGERWLELEVYRMLVPHRAPDYSRELFFSNLRLLLGVFVEEHANLAPAA